MINERFCHFRYWRPDGRHPRATIAIVYDFGGEAYRVGVAICSPKDHFQYVRGREIACGRALSGARTRVPRGCEGLCAFVAEIVEGVVKRTALRVKNDAF